jgi:AP endonuclease-2
VYGSDHCPIYVDFHDEIESEDGSILKLSDHVMNPSDAKKKAPSLAASNWPEFAGRKLQSFFAARPAVVKANSPKPESSIADKEQSSIEGDPTSMKRKMSESDASPMAKKIAAVAALKKSPIRPSSGQTNLKTFFSKPKAALPVIDAEEAPVLLDQKSHTSNSSPTLPTKFADDSKETEEEEDATAGANRVGAALAWGSIFARE